MSDITVTACRWYGFALELLIRGRIATTYLCPTGLLGICNSLLLSGPLRRHDRSVAQFSPDVVRAPTLLHDSARVRHRCTAPVDPVVHSGSSARSFQHYAAAVSRSALARPLGDCLHSDVTSTHNQHGNFLECRDCGQRWRHMRECCGILLPVGVRSPFNGRCPSSTSFQLEHRKTCLKQEVVRPVLAVAPSSISSGSSSAFLPDGYVLLPHEGRLQPGGAL